MLGPDGKLSLVMVLSGPSGSGKTTICDGMVATHANLQRIVTVTTRAPRAGEVDGEDYRFFTEERFDELVAQHAFLEWARVHGRHRYGTLKRDILDKVHRGVDVFVNIDVQGAEHYRAFARENPEFGRRLVTLFIMPRSLDEIRARLVKRGQDSRDEIERRLETARAEIAQWPKFDYCFRSECRENDFKIVEAIWRAEKQRAARA